MEKIERLNICAGVLVQNCSFLSSQVVRGIIFEKKDLRAIDLMYDNRIYSIKKAKHISVEPTMIYNLNNGLESFGYPELLDKDDVTRFLEKDFYKVLKYHSIYRNWPLFEDFINCSDVDLTKYHLGFLLTDEENKKLIK